MNTVKPDWNHFMYSTIQRAGLDARRDGWSENSLVKHMRGKGARDEQISEAVQYFRHGRRLLPSGQFVSA